MSDLISREVLLRKLKEHEENIAILKSMIPEYEMKNKVVGVKAFREAIKDEI